MNIVPKSGPSLASVHNTQTSYSADARARAIAKVEANLSGTPPSAAQATPVLNANQVSPEELGAIRAPGSEENNTTETPPEATTDKTPAKEDPLSSQYATLARKEKALRAQVQQFNAEKAKYKAEQESRPSTPTFDESQYVSLDRLKANPLDVLIEQGLSYDDITQAILSQSQIQTDPAVKAAIARIEADAKAAREEAQATKKLYEDQQKNSYQQALSQIKAETKQMVYTDPNFEMIKETGSVNDVVELIEKTFQKDGVLLSVEEACQAVEDHLLEEATKLSKIKKLQQRLGQQPAPAPVTQTKQPQQTQQKQTTLSNTMSSTKPMTSRERAIAAIEGRLK